MIVLSLEHLEHVLSQLWLFLGSPDTTMHLFEHHYMLFVLKEQMSEDLVELLSL